MAMPDRPKTAAPSAVLIAHAEPKSPAAEAYRSLRTSIQFAGLDHKCRTIMMTSSSPGEGKSTTVANFGVVMAQTGSRVCLIDSDLRRPTLHRVFGLGNARGLTTALLGSATAALTSTRVRLGCVPAILNPLARTKAMAVFKKPKRKPIKPD